ncbi:Sodium/glucose cotransporter [Polystyrenella longa]|uniref:Sodium/glucose cotransporter n=1 Tax=Polystyrenella longa TaxID=2528007 RepID=A0A518CMJ5_9PLAN|nr:sodium:solute symporter family protein [Polystyrenella longa]QDU80442.1 Sodium/glucose cotransporter [Polystyrenella longa]
MELFQTNFTSLDWGIVIVYIAASALVGLWANKYVGNLSDYLVAGRTLRIRLALASMTGTELGLVTVIYMAQLGFTQQYAALYLGVLEGVALLMIGATGFVVVKLRQTEVMTIPEYYEQRYSSGVRVLGGTVMVLAGVLNMGLFLKAGSIFVTALTGMDDPDLIKWVMTVMLLLVLFYTVLGGMVSVVITDLIQFFVLGTSLLVACVFILGDLGLDGLRSIATDQHGYVNPFDSLKPEGAFNIVNGDQAGIGFTTIFQMMIIVGAASFLWPTTASRTLSVKNTKVARQLFFWSAIPLLARRAIPVFLGLGTFAFFASNVDLGTELMEKVGTGEVSTLAAMPLYLAKLIPTGLLGIIAAGMLAAFMSTHDSYLLTWSGVITQDICGPLFGPMSQRTRILITRVSIVVIGIMLLTWGLWYELSDQLWDYMAITGTVYFAGALPTIVGGLYWKKGTSQGAVAAILLGLTGIMALGNPVAWLDLKLHELGALPETFILNGAIMTIFTFVLSTVGYIITSLLTKSATVLEK